MLSSTSIILKTSSIRGNDLKVVVPLLRRLAHNRPTAAFLLVFKVISPLSSWPPSIAKLTPWSPTFIIGLWRTSLIRLNMSSERFWPPFSMRLTADCEVLSLFASSF